MRYKRRFLLIAAVWVTAPTLALPAPPSEAQVANHVSSSIALRTSAGPAFGTGFALGFGHRPPSDAAFFGIGLSRQGLAVSAGYSSYDDYYSAYGSYANPDYYGDYSYDTFHGGIGSGCRDLWWHSPWADPWLDPWAGCFTYLSVGYAPFGWSGWYGPGVSFFFGWPAPRFGGSWHHYGEVFAWGRGGSWDWGWPPAYRYGWDPYDYAYYGAHGYGHYPRVTSRIARRSPLFGPRYKETPRVYVTDNGPARPTSKAVPRRGAPGAGGVVQGNAGYRGRTGSVPGTRTARPRSGTEPRTSAPSVRPRTRTGSAQPRPKVVRPDRGSANTRGRVVPRPPTRRVRPESVTPQQRPSPRYPCDAATRHPAPSQATRFTAAVNARQDAVPGPDSTA